MLTNRSGGEKWMYAGWKNAGKTYKLHIGEGSGEVIVDSNGWGKFTVGDGTLAVWIKA